MWKISIHDKHSDWKELKSALFKVKPDIYALSNLLEDLDMMEDITGREFMKLATPDEEVSICNIARSKEIRLLKVDIYNGYTGKKIVEESY